MIENPMQRIEKITQRIHDGGFVVKWQSPKKYPGPFVIVSGVVDIPTTYRGGGYRISNTTALIEYFVDSSELTQSELFDNINKLLNYININDTNYEIGTTDDYNLDMYRVLFTINM